MKPSKAAISGIVGQVKHQRLGPSTKSGDLSQCLLRSGGAAIGHTHDRAFASENARSGLTDAGPGPGDDGNAVLQDHLAAFPLTLL